VQGALADFAEGKKKKEKEKEKEKRTTCVWASFFLLADALASDLPSTVASTVYTFVKFPQVSSPLNVQYNYMTVKLTFENFQQWI